MGALAVASGQAASAYAIQNLAKNGDNIVASAHLYGGTYNQFKNVFSDMGIEVRFVDPADPQNFANATDDKTRAYYGEVLPNPSFEVFPISMLLNMNVFNAQNDLTGEYGFFPTEVIESDDAIAYKLALQHDLSDNVMVYGSYTTATKAGGNNPNETGTPDPYDPEETGVLEFGIKSILMDIQITPRFYSK